MTSDKSSEEVKQEEVKQEEEVDWRKEFTGLGLKGSEKSPGKNSESKAIMIIPVDPE